MVDLFAEHNRELKELPLSIPHQNRRTCKSAHVVAGPLSGKGAQTAVGSAALENSAERGSDEEAASESLDLQATNAQAKKRLDDPEVQGKVYEQ